MFSTTWKMRTTTQCLRQYESGHHRQSRNNEDFKQPTKAADRLNEKDRKTRFQK